LNGTSGETNGFRVSWEVEIGSYVCLIQILACVIISDSIRSGVVNSGRRRL